jgi:hypothetical protein
MFFNMNTSTYGNTLSAVKENEYEEYGKESG